MDAMVPALDTVPRLPGRWPLVGHLPGLRRDPLGMLLRAARLGGVSRADLGPRGAAYLVTHPDGVRRIFLDNYANYSKQTRGFDTLRVFLGQGLLTSEGSFWRKHRRIAQPAFHHREILRFAGIMSRAAEEVAERWQGYADRRETFDAAEEMMRVTLRIVGECLFSTDPGESTTIGPQVDLLLKKFISRISAPVVLPLRWPVGSNRAVLRAIRVMQELVDGIVAERQRTGAAEPRDLLDMLITARDTETGEGMTPTQLRDEVLTLLVAGHETTAAALSWTWVLLARHPEVDRRLGAALSVAGHGPGVLADPARTPLVRQVIQESMRLYPPAWIIARRVIEADQICGVPVSPGDLVILSPYATHRRPETFPDPERFDPDRFGDAAPAGGYSKYEYFPFGAGPRICIGNGFAMQEAQIVFTTLRRRFRLELASDDPVLPRPLLTLRCRNGVTVRAHDLRADSGG